MQRKIFRRQFKNLMKNYYSRDENYRNFGHFQITFLGEFKYIYLIFNKIWHSVKTSQVIYQKLVII